jgi:hypothetical protein
VIIDGPVFPTGIVLFQSGIWAQAPSDKPLAATPSCTNDHGEVTSAGARGTAALFTAGIRDIEPHNRMNTAS